MKILWIVNAIFPYPAEKIGIEKSCFGGWAHSLYESIKNEKGNEYSIVSTYSGLKLEKFIDGNTSYYLIPNNNETKYNPDLVKYWKTIINEFNPDIVHIHGTEYPKALPLIRTFPNLNYVVSIQGFLNSYYRVYNANLPFSVLVRNITLRDILKSKTGILTYSELKNRAKYETEIVSKVNNVIGRTTWDKACVKAINPNAKYYTGEENLRACFFYDEWNIENVDRHTIFFSQAQAIIKGFYIMLEALRILKNKYPDVKVIIAGNNLLDMSSFKSKLKRQSYTKFLQKQIKKYGLENNIQFTGYLAAEDYKSKLLRSNVYVQASANENSSNSLGEAMILGLPCVASYVGGTPDMLKDREEGFLYPYTEPELLAHYIEEFFENDDLCKKMGQNARKHALKRHDWKNNAKQTLKTYESILEKKVGEI